ncbi:MAG: zinc-binding dehydrogenase [Saprospiraceae bacterium]
MKAFIINTTHEYPVKTSVPFPVLKENEVYLKLTASSLNHRDLWITKGLYPGIRIGAIMGSDGCGMIDDKAYIINPGLDWGELQSHQSSAFRVLGVPDDGTFGQFIAINKKYLFPKPEHLSHAEAASLPLAGVTAFRALIKKACVCPGDKVLITGIGGGVALFAMQFALAMGCYVVVSSSNDLKIAEAINLGANAGYLYTNPDWAKNLIADIGGVDIIIDGACGDGFEKHIKVCNPGGRIVFYGATAGKIENINPQTIFWRQISIMGTTMGSQEDFSEMVDFVKNHKISPVIYKTLDFEEIAKGFEIMESGSQFGKIVFSYTD